MTPRERVIKCIRHEEPDRVPLGETGIDPSISEKVLGHPTYYRGGVRTQKAVWEGRTADVMDGHKQDMVDLYTRLDYDLVPIFLGDDVSRARKHDVKWIDEDTVEVEGERFGFSAETHEFVRFPTHVTRDITQWQPGPGYRSPSDGRWELFDYLVKRLPDRFLLARSVNGLWPMGAAGDSPECYTAYLTNPEDCLRVNRHLCDRECLKAQDFIKHGAQAVFIGGDYCDSRSPMISPRTFRAMIFPFLKEICAAIHAVGGFAVKHTDGNTWPLLDMYADAGIDILHAIQPSASMDIRKMKERYRKAFTFMGAVDCDALVRGTPEQVRNEVDYCLRWAAPGGGLILCSGNTVQYGVPYENFKAMVDRCREKGRYPIDFTGLNPKSLYNAE